LSLAALERFVNTDPDLEPDELVAIAVDIELHVAVGTIVLADLPADWRVYPPPPALTELGGRWLRALTSVVLSVPSAVIPSEHNFILNPAYSDFDNLTIHPS